MTNGKAQLLQKSRAEEITKAARSARAELESYLEDLQLYSRKEFWEAVWQAESGKVKKYKRVKEFIKRNG